MAKRGKYGNYLVLRSDPSLRSSLPFTMRFSRENVNTMLKRYGSVILKPTYGSGGIRVVKAARLPNGSYMMHAGAKRTVFANKEGLLASLTRFTNAIPFVVQRYIPLFKLNGRPVDIRVMVQRKPGIPWTVTGKVAKVAGPGRIITNVARSKGYILPVNEALTRVFSKKRSASILKQLDHVGLLAAKHMGRAYGFRTLGFDMAVDRHGKVWYLETNSIPALSLFRNLKDKSQYRTILKFK